MRHPLWVGGVLISVGLLVCLAGCSGGPRELMLTSAESQRPLDGVLLVQEMLGSYEDYGYRMGPEWPGYYGAWRGARLNYPWPIWDGIDRRPTWETPQDKDYIKPIPVPVKVSSQTIDHDWKIRIEINPPSIRDREWIPVFRAVHSYLFKPGFVPVKIDENQWPLMANKKGIVRVGMQPLTVGTQTSDVQTLSVVKSALPLATHPDLKGELKRRFHQWMADPLLKIMTLPASPEPYPGFAENRKQAQSMLQHLHVE
jgi:hypothetical protein